MRLAIKTMTALVCMLACTYCAADGTPSVAGNSTLAFSPMTSGTAGSPTYFVDPYPIYVAENGTSHPDYQMFSGTTRQVLSCQGALAPKCYQGTPISLDTGVLATQAASAGMKLGTYDNTNLFRDETGRWQMAFTVYVQNPSVSGADGHWTVIGHAHPAMNGPGVPTNWVADSVLVGSLTKPAPGNYDGKYFKDEGQLYLVYSERLQPKPAHDGIVAQPMDKPDLVAAARPTVLLAPADKGNGFNSELFHPDEPADQFKLVETGNITKIGNTYVMAYSTGAYNRPAYKTAVAYSGTFLPRPGSTYKKVFMTDTNGVWGQPGHLEVHYLLQGAKAAWPNYTGKQILAPGVPSVVNDGHGHWFLFFAGYAVDDAPKKPLGSQDFDGSHRRPFFIPLNVNIPANANVEDTPDTVLETWITAAGQ